MTDVFCTYISMANGSAHARAWPTCIRKTLALNEYTAIISRDLKSQDILRMNWEAMNTKQLYE